MIFEIRLLSELLQLLKFNENLAISSFHTKLLALLAIDLARAEFHREMKYGNERIHILDHDINSICSMNSDK